VTLSKRTMSTYERTSCRMPGYQNLKILG
jgi:hypothetical protein